jgi:hypothetical protein
VAEDGRALSEIFEEHPHIHGGIGQGGAEPGNDLCRFG